MTIIIPINGRNERMGGLFKTAKHALLYKGVPAIERTVEYLSGMFPEAEIVILVNRKYLYSVEDLPCSIKIVPDTESHVDTLLLHRPEGPVMFVDCDIVPIRINKPVGSTVYLFENREWMKQYSNYLVKDGIIIDCNEKGEYFPHAGSGIYYFENADHFYELAGVSTSIAQVIKKMICRHQILADAESEIFRFGTLNDIKNDQQLTDRLY